MKKQEELMDPRYLNYRSASLYMGVSEESIRRNKDAGELRFIKFGGRILFDSHDIDLFMSKLKSSVQKKAQTSEDDPDIDIEDDVIRLLGA